MDFTVSLNGPAPQQVTVDVATVDGEATSHGNVTATSLGQDFEARTATLTFADGEQTKTFSVVTLDDTIHERNETFTAELKLPARNPNRYASTLTVVAPHQPGRRRRRWHHRRRRSTTGRQHQPGLLHSERKPGWPREIHRRAVPSEHHGKREKPGRWLAHRPGHRNPGSGLPGRKTENSPSCPE